MQSDRSLTPAALALVLAVVRTFGDEGADGRDLSVAALNRIQRALGETDDMGADDVAYLLSFERHNCSEKGGAAAHVAPRSLSAMGYAAFVLEWLREGFDGAIACLRQLGVHGAEL